MKLTRLFAATAAALVFASSAGAQAVVYSNGLPDDVSGNNLAGTYTQAEDFTFASATQFDGIRFWSAEYPPSGFGGIAYYWSIYTDNAGSIGTLLYQGGSTPTRTAQGPACCSADRFQNDLYTGSISLGAGTYWLTMNDPLGDGVFWETTATNGTSFGMESSDGQSWVSTDMEHAFELTVATPEPASLVLLGTGLVAVFGFARRRRA